MEDKKGEKMKKIISVLMSIVIMAVTVEREVIEAFAVDQAQIKGIQMGYVGTECIQIKAEVGGNKAGYKYKFVWLERSRLGRDWGVQNVNWGVIREFGETDTVKWKAPRMPADYEIYMDVMDSKRDIKTIHKSFYGLSGLRKVSKEQIKGIEIGINGEALKIRAVMEGERRWYKYKFVWLEGSRAGGNWGVRNVNWGVIREFGFADTVMWKPPKMPKDYVIYMDVMDAHGTHIDGYNRYYEGEIIKTRQEAEQSERMRKELETKVNQAKQRAAQQEKEIREIENQVARVKREFAESERKRKEVAGKLEESKRKAEEFERSRKELEIRLSKAKQELEEREKRKKELQRKVDQAKQTVEKNKKVQKENQSRKGEIEEQLEKEKQRTRSLEEELQEVKKQVEEEEKRQKIRRENERKERKAEEQKEESKEEKIIWESRGSPGNIIEGGYYSQEDGHWIEDETIESSCLIPVEESRGYTATQIDGDVTWWDTEKRLIGKTSKEKFKQKGYVTAPKGAKYARYVFGSKTEPKRVIKIAEKKPEVEYTLLKKEEKKKTPETLSEESTVRAEDLCKANPEYSKYEKYIKEITEELSNKNSKVGKEALSSRDTSLETITKKLKYVCCRMSQEKRVTAYPVQILATMKLVESVLSAEPGMKGSVGDIKTGEGKSLVVTLTAIILQSYGRKVDIVTPNMELATRDWRESKKYYELFGITSGFLYDKVKDSEFKDAENESEESKEDYKAEYNYEVLSRGIVYTTGSNMQWMYLKSTFSAEELRSREYDVCIADEVDNLLIDGATTPALISSNFPTKQVEKIQERVYQSALAGKNADEIKEILQGEFKESKVSDEELALMMRAVEISQKAENGKDYVLEKDEYGRTRVLIIDRNTGFPLKLSRWHAYVHEMIEIKEGIVSQPTSVTKCAISPMIFFGAYKNLLGVTGTVGGKREEEIFRRI